MQRWGKPLGKVFEKRDGLFFLYLKAKFPQLKLCPNLTCNFIGCPFITHLFRCPVPLMNYKHPSGITPYPLFFVLRSHP